MKTMEALAVIHSLSCAPAVACPGSRCVCTEDVRLRVSIERMACADSNEDGRADSAAAGRADSAAGGRADSAAAGRADSAAGGRAGPVGERAARAAGARAASALALA